jgi:hypothetical protein
MAAAPGAEAVSVRKSGDVAERAHHHIECRRAAAPSGARCNETTDCATARTALHLRDTIPFSNDLTLEPFERRRIERALRLHNPLVAAERAVGDALLDFRPASR